MSIYLTIVIAVLVLGAVMPQKGRERIWYIALMTALHAFVCAFRYEHLTGDLMNYHWDFIQLGGYGWFSAEVLHEGRNTGFYMLMKLVNELSGEDFQSLLILIAVVTHLILGYIIYRYSPMPWFSFLIWNGMAFYVFGFNAIKQALSMSFIMLAFVGIHKKRPIFYCIMIALASFIHMPALIFLPAYWLAQMRVNWNTVIMYVILGILLYVFKRQFVKLISLFYYDNDEFTVFTNALGNRCIMIIGFTMFGILLRGFHRREMEVAFHLMALAAILQMLSSFDNVFTRLTDYYYQFSVIYLPLVFFGDGNGQRRSLVRPVLPFNKRSMKVLAGVVAAYVLWFYVTYSGVFNGLLGGDTFQFMWEVT